MRDVGTGSATDLLCFAEDDYVRDAVRWVADLSDGSAVYADDDRPGLPGGMESAWVRLKAHCLASGVRVVGMRLQFRSNVVWLPPDGEGYYLARQAFGVWGDPESYHAYVAGVYAGGVARVGRWKTPEMSFMGWEDRAPNPDDPRLILSTRELTI